MQSGAFIRRSGWFRSCSVQVTFLVIVFNAKTTENFCLDCWANDMRRRIADPHLELFSPSDSVTSVEVLN